MDDTDNSNILSIDDLNDDCLIHIFTFLSMPDRLRIERVSKRWRSLAQLSWRTMKHLRLDDDFHLQLEDDDSYVDSEDDDTDANVEVLQKVLLLCGPYLRSIEFEHDCIESSETVISNIHTFCPKVEEIYVGPKCKFSTLETVVNNFTEIKSFSARHLDFSDGDWLAKFFCNNKKLKSMIIYFCAFSAECFSHINHEAVEKLHLDSNAIDSIDLLINSINKFNNLQSFIFTIYTGLFSAFVNLESDNFSPTIPKTVAINRLLQSITLNCLKLRELRLSGIEAITDVGFTWITNLLQLERLSLSKANISDKVLSNLKTLQYLYCYGCLLIKNDGLTNLIMISKNIRKIDLIECQSIHSEGLIDSIKKSSMHVLEVNTSSEIEGYNNAKISYSFRKEDNQLRVKIKLERNCFRFNCSKWEYIYYIE